MNEPALAFADEPDFDVLRRLVYRESELAFAKMVCPWAKIEEIHVCFATIAEEAARGNLDRVIIECPPRGMKSYWWSVITPAWWIGRFPQDKVMSVSYKIDLTKDFSRDAKNILRTPEYQWCFPGIQLSRESSSVSRWRINEIMIDPKSKKARMRDGLRGQFHGAGVTSGIAGTGWNLGIVDDPLSEQDKDSKLAKDRVWKWWGPGFYTRGQPDERNIIVICNTRWATDDLTGRLRELGKNGGDKWEVFSIPAILDRTSAKKIYHMVKAYGPVPGVFDEPHKLKVGGSFSPRRFSLEHLARLKANMPARDWNALFMQNPTDEEGQILKTKWWRLWEKDELPECVLIFQMYDTALEAKQANDNSARTTWGVFEHKEEDGRVGFHVILLDAWEDKVSTPELRHKVVTGVFGGKRGKEILTDRYPGDKDLIEKIDEKEPALNPDEVWVEKKAGAEWLIQELHRMEKPKLPIRGWKGPRGTQGELGGYARAQLAAWTLEQGAVWYPDRDWAEKVIAKCAACRFDGSDEHDDIENTVVNALLLVRQRYRVDLPADVDEDARAEAKAGKKKRRGYGHRS